MLTANELDQILTNAGFKGVEIPLGIALALVMSGGDPGYSHVSPITGMPVSTGLWGGYPSGVSLPTPIQLANPMWQAKAARASWLYWGAEMRSFNEGMGETTQLTTNDYLRAWSWCKAWDSYKLPSMLVQVENALGSKYANAAAKARLEIKPPTSLELIGETINSTTHKINYKAKALAKWTGA